MFKKLMYRYQAYKVNRLRSNATLYRNAAVMCETKANRAERQLFKMKAAIGQH